MSDKFCHVRLYYKSDTNHYYAQIKASDGEYLLDLGEDEENVKKVVEVLTKEFGGIPMHPGQIN